MAEAPALLRALNEEMWGAEIARDWWRIVKKWPREKPASLPGVDLLGQASAGIWRVHAQLLILALRQRRTAATGRDASLQGSLRRFSLRRAAQSGVCESAHFPAPGRRFAAYDAYIPRQSVGAAGKQTAARRNSELPGLILQA